MSRGICVGYCLQLLSTYFIVLFSFSAFWMIVLKQSHSWSIKAHKTQYFLFIENCVHITFDDLVDELCARIESVNYIKPRIDFIHQTNLKKNIKKENIECHFFYWVWVIFVYCLLLLLNITRAWMSN